MIAISATTKWTAFCSFIIPFSCARCGSMSSNHTSLYKSLILIRPMGCAFTGTLIPWSSGECDPLSFSAHTCFLPAGWHAPNLWHNRNYGMSSTNSPSPGSLKPQLIFSVHLTAMCDCAIKWHHQFILEDKTVNLNSVEHSHMEMWAAAPHFIKHVAKAACMSWICYLPLISSSC